MAEKNIQLKDGDNKLYPLTKIGNVNGLQTELDDINTSLVELQNALTNVDTLVGSGVVE